MLTSVEDNVRLHIPISSIFPVKNALESALSAPVLTSNPESVKVSVPFKVVLTLTTLSIYILIAVPALVKTK